MNPISIRLDSDTVAELDAEADAKGISRNSHLKGIIAHRNEYSQLKDEYERLRNDYADLKAEKERIETHRDALEEGHSVTTEQLEAIVSERDRLREEVDDLKRDRDRFERKLTAANSRQDDLGEVVEYVEGEKSLAERREERGRAPVWRRFRYWLLGTPEDETGETDS